MKTKKDNIYFTEDVDSSIFKFQQTTSSFHRNLIYEKEIHSYLSQLCLNVINTYKLYNGTNDSVEDLRNECEAFLYKKIEKFTSGSGKAYSYFGTVCKNYLLQKNAKYIKRSSQDISINNEALREELNYSLYEDFNDDYLDNELNSQKIKILINYYCQQTKNEDEKKVCNALITLFENSEYIDIFNKKNIYLVIREITGLQTKYITKAIKKIKNQVFEEYDRWRKTN